MNDLLSSRVRNQPPELKAEPFKRNPKFLITFCLLMAVVSSPAHPQGVARFCQNAAGWGVYTADVRTGKVRKISDIYDWVISPDERWVAGQHQNEKNGGDTSILAVPLSGGKPRFLARLKPFVPFYSPGVKWLKDSTGFSVYRSRNEADTVRLSLRLGTRPTKPVASKRTRHLSASARRRVALRFPSIEDVTFSPDGRLVAASCSRGDYQKSGYNGGIFIFRPDGSGLKQITYNVAIQKKDAHDVKVHWLSDGQTLVFDRRTYEDEGL